MKKIATPIRKVALPIAPKQMPNKVGLSFGAAARIRAKAGRIVGKQ